MKFASHPFWLAGFRPLFALACVAGAGLPVLWVAVYAGAIAAPANPFSTFQWHAHEMFFGFGWAVLGGFLLTSTKNWVGIRGYHGGALMFLAAAWIFERAGMWFGGAWPAPLFLLSNNLYLASVVAMLLWTLIRHHRTDSFRDNIIFVVILPIFLIAKHQLLGADTFQLGWMTTIALFRVAFLIMLERTLSQFMKGVFQVEILRHPALDAAIKLLAVVLVCAGWLPPTVFVGLSLLLALLLAVRFAFWRPHLAMRRLDIGIMYLGYLAIVLQLLLDVLDQLAHPAWVGSVAVHVFTFGAMGLIAPALLMRISKGHTGRKVAFDSGDKWALRIMMLAFMLRVVAPQAYPAGYIAWIVMAAACWCACFALLGWRYIPFLWQPRVDGKEH
ncbi:MAG: NnrS family protein [Rhodocyclaceae bacterium]|nr:NnrS family protein [Rhodocyclaceae bacterium]